MKLGINGLGRIGKLSLWHHVGRKHFSSLVVNLGRDVGQGLQDIAAAIERDSSYGRLGNYLHGFKAQQVIEELNETAGTMVINGIPVTFLREARNPKDIKWKENGVRLVVDTTGVFNDPTAPPDSPKGALRGHLQAGAEKAILSAPFKIKDQGPGNARRRRHHGNGHQRRGLYPLPALPDFGRLLHHHLPFLHDQTPAGSAGRR